MAMDTNIKVLLKKVGAEPEVVDVCNKLESLKALVGGHIETVSFDYDNRSYALVCDEEGKLAGKEYNMMFGNDTLVGDIFFVRVGVDDFISLDDKDIEKLKELITEMINC